MSVKSAFFFAFQRTDVVRFQRSDQQHHPNFGLFTTVYHQQYAAGGGHTEFCPSPFCKKSIVFGIYGSVFSCILLGILMTTYKRELSGVIDMSDFISLGTVFLIVLAAGIILSWISTYFAVNRFLKLKFDELFY
jgi:hypothetical protein